MLQGDCRVPRYAPKTSAYIWSKVNKSCNCKKYQLQVIVNQLFRGSCPRVHSTAEEIFQGAFFTGNVFPYTDYKIPTKKT